ncbi:MAG: hypothetical protein LBV41_12545 [Cytophagaceae bacterium]|jgi:uncharacterized protein YfaS (alpha-2-macroglobulin family)|nr:hypothetical protein [Cytophagaceae bacterium]
MLKTRTLISLCIVIALAGCTGKKADNTTFHSPFHARIAAFTSGLISTDGNILVEFADSVPNALAGGDVPSAIVSVSPKLQGKWTWFDHKTMHFTPAEKLQPDKKWQVTVHLKKIFADEKDDFFFEFGTFPQNFRITTDVLHSVSADDVSALKFTGKVAVADGVADAEIEAMLEAELNGRNVAIAWQHADAKNHLFEISPIPRTDKAGKLEISYNGKAIGVSQKGEITVIIPALGEFSVQSVQVVQSPRQLVRVVFSDPLMRDQNLSGLVYINGYPNAPYEINENIVEIYPSTTLYGEQEIYVIEGVRNIKGNEIDAMHIEYIQFSSMKPEVEILGQGNIMPFSNNILVHFKAVALKSVIVRVIKIYENNIPSFLQINSIGDDNQLKRAGRLVHQSLISLESDATLDLNQPNTFALELSKLIQPEPGAIYRLELGFLKWNAFYPCSEPEQTVNVDEELRKIDGDFWDTPDDYYSSYWDVYAEDWNWNDTENPCTNSYYTRSKWARRNLIATDIGLISKAGSDGAHHVFVTDLRTTQPIADVTVELLNFQTQLIATGKTDGEGRVTLSPKEKPFLVVATKGKQKNYLRVDDGRMLPVARFDVSGQTIPKGIKGYIYGERGVWRPGDSIFVSFIPEDKNNKLPAGHPVVFELMNPRGQLMNRQVSRHPENRIYSFRAATTEDDITGIWLARVIVGDAVFEQPLRIETVKPNRLRIALDFDTELLEGDKTIYGKLSSEWLHGALASNLNADVAVTLSPRKTTFPAYSEFNFDDDTRDFYGAEQTVFSGKLNSEGKTNLNFRPQLNQAVPGMMTAAFRTRVYEESGSFSIDRLDVPYSPYSRYVGLRAPKGDKRGMLLTDETHNIEIATLNAKGQGVSVRRLKYKIYKINWRWWWEKTEDDLARYISSYSSRAIDSGETSTVNGKGTLPFRVNKPEWGRFLIHVVDEEGGHASSIVVIADWPGWAQKPGMDGDAASMLIFSADKESYQTGETAEVVFPSAEGGRALVSLENGSSIVQAWWVDTKKEQTKFSFKITEAMTPNVYIHISLLQPHGQKANDLPIRMYGVIPIMVYSPASVLSPEIKTPDEWHPQEKITVTISEKNNRPMSYTLAIVDEGLLNLTRFKTPNAWYLFNAREALGVKSWDMYDQVLSAYGGRIERLFTIGGGDELRDEDSDKDSRRFEPMVRFIGPFELKKGSAKHTIDIPNYIGSVRVMVVATSGAANGSTEKTVPVRKSLMVLGTLPRVLGPSEKVLLPVTVFASGTALGNVTVTVNADKNLTFSGNKQQTVRFDKDGEQTIFFELNVGDVIGKGKIEIVAQSGNEKALNEINIPIRNPNPPITRVVSKVVAENSSATLDYALLGVKSTNKAVLEVSTIPPMDFGRRLEYLLGYPHGCIEQITSGGFPQIFLPEVVQLEPEAMSRAQSNVKSVIERLHLYQTNSGGFAYWMGGTQADEWASSYAGHFMLEAEKRGHTIPRQLKNAWLNYQKKAAANWLPNRNGNHRASDFIQAYRLFSLALAGDAAVSGMNRLKQQTNLSNQARWRLAAAYALAGMGEVAKEIVETAPETVAKENAEYYSYSYGSPERDMAMALETLVLLGNKESAARQAIELAKVMNSSQWMSTQTTAYCLLAMSSYAGGNKLGSDETKIRYKVNNGKNNSVGFSLPLLRQDLNLEEQPLGNITLENNSKGQVFVNLIIQGQPLKDTVTTAVSSGITMSVEYFDLDGKAIDSKSIAQGTDFKTVVRLYNTGATTIRNLALTQIFPSGWEIRNTRFEETGASYEIDVPTYRDIRDDRVYSYLDLNAGETKRLVTVLHASFAGNYYMPAVNCEAMYDYSVRASNTGQWVKVEKVEK